MDEEHEVVESYHAVNILRKDQNRVIKQFIGLPSVKNGSTISFTIGGMKGSWTSVPDVEVNGSKMDVASLFGYSESGQTVTVSLKITGNTDIVITDTWNYAVETTYSIQEPAATATSTTTNTQVTVPTVEDKDFPKTVQLEGSKDSSNWTKTLDNLEKYYKHTDGKVYKWVYYIESEEVNAFYFYEADSERKNSGTLTIINHRNTVEGYELPKTGGIGVIPYALIGLGLSGSAIIGEETIRRRKKKEEETKE
jgi:LPXTG-motif cell wall-anchored protein